MTSVASGDLSPLEQCRLKTWPLRQWLYQHRYNPYPTKADKKLLAREANMRPDQVAMWFANTRRRIKKVGMQNWSGGAFTNSDFRPRTTTRSASSGKQDQDSVIFILVELRWRSIVFWNNKKKM